MERHTITEIMQTCTCNVDVLRFGRMRCSPFQPERMMHRVREEGAMSFAVTIKINSLPPMGDTHVTNSQIAAGSVFN